MTLEHLSLALGLIGLSCFLWPILMRVAGKPQPAASGGGQGLRSPLWWAGLVLTAAAIFIQRMAQGGAV